MKILWKKKNHLNNAYIFNMRIKHIDGLRAYSVIAVVLFHALPETFPNAYIGVDYFLVISGYVISKKYIFTNNKFNFLNFWKRRIIRLYPQLIACILLCIPFALFMMSPDLLENFFQSCIASLLAANNILLSLTSGYWGSANELKPLYTTWSLALEEQFYLLLSLLFLFFDLKKRKNLLLLLGAILFITSIFFCFNNGFLLSKSNYLLLPSRFWEFSIGIIAAWISEKEYKMPSYTSPISLVIIIFFTFENFTIPQNAPSVFFFVPLLSVALICIDSSTNKIQQLLSLKPFAYIGLASYSIYLYHQPLLAFSRLSSYEKLDQNISIFIIFISILVGTLMYELIEKKGNIFLNLFDKYSENFRTIALLIFSLLIAMISFWAVLGKGWFKSRFPHLLINGEIPLGFLGGKEYTDIPYKFLNKEFQENDNKIKILFIGDSKIRDLINAFILIEDELNTNFDLSYIDSYDKKNNLHKKIANNAQLVFTQMSHERMTHLPKNRVILVETRNNFIHNINPIFYKKDIDERINFRTKDYEIKKDLFYFNKNSQLVLSDIQPFLDEKGFKKITDIKGNLVSFDGIHLSGSGVRVLGDSLKENVFLIEKIRIIKSRI